MRHGRQTRGINKEKNNKYYDEKLNDAIEYIEAKCPDQWNIILAHIDSLAVMPPNMFKIRNITDTEVSRKAFECNAYGNVFARLARLKEQDEIEKKEG